MTLVDSRCVYRSPSRNNCVDHSWLHRVDTVYKTLWSFDKILCKLIWKTTLLGSAREIKKCVCSCALLLGAPATTKGLKGLIQSPDVSVTEGESINITCCWSGLVGKIRVNWMKDGKNRTEVKYKSVTVANKTELDKERESLTCSLFTLESVMIEHSGNYTCLLTVEIPKLARHEGKGTTVTVTTKNNTATSTTTDGKKCCSSTISSSFHSTYKI